MGPGHPRKRRWTSTSLAAAEAVNQEVSLAMNCLPQCSLQTHSIIGLRQAPAPRQLFQPDASASKQNRHSSGHLQSPQPGPAAHTGYNYSATSNPNSSMFAIQNYEPPPRTALTLRPIMTPGNNPAHFRENQRRAREARKVELGLVSPTIKGMMKPGGKCCTKTTDASNLIL